MKVAGNKISDMLNFFRDHLKNIYNTDEIDELTFIAFNHVIGINKTEFYQNQEERINQSDLILIYDIGKALACHKPIQYIIGEAYFYGLKFHVNKHVLIPRPETEELVELVLQQYSNAHKKDLHVLDIGTGSGCIPISIKKQAPLTNVFAIDISPEALDVAYANAHSHEVEICFKQLDILTEKQFEQHRFDYIISNPPYIASSEKQEMQKNVLDFEPHLALFVKDSNPLLFYDKIAEFALQNLNSQGKLFFEINQALSNEVCELLSNKGFKNVTAKKDINGNDRMVWATI